MSKILNSLAYGAIGDAMGAATENLSFNQIRKKFNGKVQEFLKPDEANFALGNEAGQVTDDFSQTYLLCRKILENNGVINEKIVKLAILEWSDMPQYFDRFAGPTTRSAVKMFKTGAKELEKAPGAVTVDYSSKATNGSAMKISPAGLFNPGNPNKAIEDAITITRVTHDNHLAISGACAVASAISTGLKENSNIDDIIKSGIEGSMIGEEKGILVSREVGGASVTERIKLAIKIASQSKDKDSIMKDLYDIIGSGLHVSEAVPISFGILKANENNPFEAVIDAVNIGYDTDTVAIITGTMAGSICYEINDKIENMIDILEEKNKMGIRELAREIEKINL